MGLIPTSILLLQMLMLQSLSILARRIGCAILVFEAATSNSIERLLGLRFVDFVRLASAATIRHDRLV